jgi:hypothetical protein
MTNSRPGHDAEFARILEMALRARIEDEQLPLERGRDWLRNADPNTRQAIEELLSSPAYMPVGKLAQLYSEEPASRAPERARELDRFLAEELRLSPDLSVEELRRLRREFAIYNHPDRVTASERELATRRMALVNVLIDRALREKKPGRA